jgi:hypothetical protein
MGDIFRDSFHGGGIYTFHADTQNSISDFFRQRESDQIISFVVLGDNALAYKLGHRPRKGRSGDPEYECGFLQVLQRAGQKAGSCCFNMRNAVR